MSTGTQIEPWSASLTLTSADTEYSYAIPAGVKAIQWRESTAAIAIRFSANTGEVATSTLGFLMAAGEVQGQGGDGVTPGITMTYGGTLYFASSTAGAIVRFFGWR